MTWAEWCRLAHERRLPLTALQDVARLEAQSTRAPTYVVRRADGRLLVLDWETSGVAWVRSAKYATKFSRTLARLAAFEFGGVPVEPGAGRQPQPAE